MKLETPNKQQALETDEGKRGRRAQKTSGKRKRSAAQEKGLKEDPSPSEPTEPGAQEEKQEEDERQDGTGSPSNLPAGFTATMHERGRRREVFFAVSCHGSNFRLDRLVRIKKFFDSHGACRSEWRPLAQQEGESYEQHVQRLKQHFSFNPDQSKGTVVTVQEESAAQAESPATKRQRKADSAVKAAWPPPKQPGSQKRAAKTSEDETQAAELLTSLHDEGSNKNCAKRLTLPVARPAAQPGSKMQAVAKEDDPVCKDAPSPVADQPADQQRASVQPEPARSGPCLTRQQWDAEQDMMELGRHLQDSLDVFQQRSDSFRMFVEIDSATAIAAEELVGRQVRVLWANDGAWFLGSVSSYNPDNGSHEVMYEDGDVENILMGTSRVRLEVSAGETLLPPSASDLSKMAQHALREAKERAESREEAEEMRGRAEELRALAQQAAAAKEGQGSDHRPPSDTAEARHAAFGLGEVVWAREKGWPAWPSIVITRESARDLSSLRPCKGGVTVWFFGTYEMGCIKPGEIMGLRAGLEQELHAKCKRSIKVFRRALHEAYTYLQTGKLPDQMVLDNNDESWFADADEAPDGDFTGADFPLRLGKNLTVNALGRIEYLRQAFHNKKYLWPLGYSAVRTEALPSGKRLACHCQILSSPDTLAPIFRVTVEGGVPVEADHPGRAWKEVLQRAGVERRAAGLSGPRMFGLDNPAVARLIQALPHAGRCTSFDAWLGQRPPCEPLSPEEEKERDAIEAAAQRLPPGIHAVPAARAVQGVCSVCGEEEETEQNHLLQCDGCREFVHMGCYGVEAPPEGRLWLCDVCKLGPSQAPACALCPVEGGVLKRTTCNRWVHSACTLWVPETAIDLDRGLVDGLQYIPKGRFQLSCSVCSQAYGACIQCAGHRSCFASFHPLCARSAGLCMVVMRDEYESDSDAEGGAVSAAQESDENRAPNCGPAGPHAQQKDAQQQVIAVRADCSDAAAGASESSPKDVASDGGTPAGAQLDELPRSSDVSEQTSCPPLEGQGNAAGKNGLGPLEAEADLSRKQAAESTATAAASAQGRCRPNKAAAAENASTTGAKSDAQGGAPRTGVAAKAARPKRVWREGTALSSGLRLMCYCAKHTALLGPSTAKLRMSIVTGMPLRGLHSRTEPKAPMQQSATPIQPPAAPSDLASTGGVSGAVVPCSRCVPYNHELRRGHRAPNAVAAALAKRAFVRATPYLVTTARARQAACSPLPAVRCHNARQPSELFKEARAQAARSNPGAARPAGAAAAADEGGPATGGRLVQSLAERFKEMRRSVTERLTCGKSAIHGWGAFTKMPAAASDMLVEYMGELLRRPVADARERRTYDRLVGAGTYVFALSDTLVVDATRKGNMAHLLNHSCEPNSYSRTISVRCPDTGMLSDHVVIFAKRAIAAGEELTYDYRFSGEEQLPCNCGAATCRGFVNLPKASADSDVQLVLRSRLKPYVTPATPTTLPNGATQCA